MKRPITILSLLLAITLTVACSSGNNSKSGGSDDASAIRSRVSSLIDHFNSGDAKAILDNDVPASARRTCSDKDAKDTITTAKQSLTSLGLKLSLKSVDNVVVTGNKATADVLVNTGSPLGAQPLHAQFVKDGGSWRLDTSAAQGCNGLVINGLG